MTNLIPIMVVWLAAGRASAAPVATRSAAPAAAATLPGFAPVTEEWSSALRDWMHSGVELPGMPTEPRVLRLLDGTARERLAPLIAGFQALGYRPSRLPRRAADRQRVLASALAAAATEAELRAQRAIRLWRSEAGMEPAELDRRAEALERFASLYGLYLEDPRLADLRNESRDARSRAVMARALAAARSFAPIETGAEAWTSLDGSELRDAVGALAPGLRPEALLRPARDLAEVRATMTPRAARLYADGVLASAARFADRDTHRAAVADLALALAREPAAAEALAPALERLAFLTPHADVSSEAAFTLLRAAEGRFPDAQLVLGQAAERILRRQGARVRIEGARRLRGLAGRVHGDDLDASMTLERLADRVEPPFPVSARAPVPRTRAFPNALPALLYAFTTVLAWLGWRALDAADEQPVL